MAAVALSCAVIAAKDPEAVVAFFPADHLIEPMAAFQQVVEKGYELVETSPTVLLTFGIKPDRPATGYGYLELAEELEHGGQRFHGSCMHREVQA